MDRALLILDLDETLVYARRKLDGYGYEFQVGDCYVSCRPHLSQFLNSVLEMFTVAVWTSAGEDYGRRVIEQIFPDPSQLAFSWFADRCTRRFDAESREQYFLKDLEKVRRMGFNLERVLMIDDTANKLGRQYGNLVLIGPFYGDPADRELQTVLPFLVWIRNQPSFRSIEKRNWRTHSSCAN
jgi:RNA polymerase II subunit A small phosphatase-like protein